MELTKVQLKLLKDLAKPERSIYRRKWVFNDDMFLVEGNGYNIIRRVTSTSFHGLVNENLITLIADRWGDGTETYYRLTVKEG
jgi:hypothetical protein